MKNIADTLRRIDREIDQHRQNIAISRLRISELEDSRKTFMMLAEQDMEAAQQPREPEFLPPGSKAAPKLIVRKASEEPEPKRRSRNGKAIEPGAMVAMKARALKTLDGEKEGMTAKQIANHLGLKHPREKIRLGNALQQLKARGEVIRPNPTKKGDPNALWVLAVKPPTTNGAAAH